MSCFNSTLNIEDEKKPAICWFFSGNNNVSKHGKRGFQERGPHLWKEDTLTIPHCQRVALKFIYIDSNKL